MRSTFNLITFVQVARRLKSCIKSRLCQKKFVRSWLTKQTLQQGHVLLPMEINHLHYEVTKPNEQHQFDFPYMLHSVFEENTYQQVQGYILIGVNVASGYKVSRPLRTKKASDVAFVLQAIYEEGGMFKYPKVFQFGNGSEFKREVAKLLEKHNVDVRGATTKYNHPHKAFDEAFNKAVV